MRKLVLFICLMLYFGAKGQRIEEAMQVFVKDSQMRHAIAALAVLDANTGKMIYGYNEQIGLAAASTQKIITSAAAFELLGNKFRYITKLAYGKDLYIIGSGDPTLGSWRYSDTKDSVILKKFVDAVSKKKHHTY